MATSQSILDALSNLGDQMCEARALADTLVDLNGIDENAPAWPFVVMRMVLRITEASEQLETLVRQKALPVLQDMEAINNR